MKRAPYYSQSVRTGIREIVARTTATTVDELAAISYLIEIESHHNQIAMMRSTAHGRAKAGAYPVSAPAVPAASEESGAAVSKRGTR